MPNKAKKRANRSKKQSGNASKAKRDKKLSQKKQDQHVQGDEASAAGPAGKTARGEIRPEYPLSTSRSSASADCIISVAGAASAPTKLISHTKDPVWELPTRGLANLGSTCFPNSVLQNMFKTRLLHQALLGDASGREDDAFVGPVTKALRKTILEIKGKGSGVKSRVRGGVDLIGIVLILVSGRSCTPQPLFGWVLYVCVCVFVLGYA